MFGYHYVDLEIPAIVIVGLWLILLIISAMRFRVVVPTNEVHIVQSRRKTTSFGKDQPAGNTYYRWPAWFPRVGIRVIMLPVSVFDVKLDAYAAYDKGRVPFVIDILAFFRIENSNEAAQRVSSFQELQS
jgi:flotillin